MKRENIKILLNTDHTEVISYFHYVILISPYLFNRHIFLLFVSCSFIICVAWRLTMEIVNVGHPTICWTTSFFTLTTLCPSVWFGCLPQMLKDRQATSQTDSGMMRGPLQLGTFPGFPGCQIPLWLSGKRCIIYSEFDSIRWQVCSKTLLKVIKTLFKHVTLQSLTNILW